MKLAILFSVLLLTGCTASSMPAVSAEPLRVMQATHGLHERSDRKVLRAMLGVDPSNTPWCGYMLAYTMKRIGRKLPAGYASAASWTTFGKRVPVVKARPGDVVLVSRKGGSGHVGIMTRRVKGKVCLLGGNTSNKVGESCYVTSRVRAVRR